MVDGPAEDMPGEIEEENREPLSAGAVVLLVKMGVAVGIERCDRAIATLTQLTNNYEDVELHVNANERIQALREDIDMLNRVLTAEGGVIDDAPAPKGIAGAAAMLQASAGSGGGGLVNVRAGGYEPPS